MLREAQEGVLKQVLRQRARARKSHEKPEDPLGVSFVGQVETSLVAATQQRQRVLIASLGHA